MEGMPPPTSPGGKLRRCRQPGTPQQNQSEGIAALQGATRNGKSKPKADV